MTDSNFFEAISATASDPRRVQHSMAELPAIEAELDEMLERQTAQSAGPLAVSEAQLQAAAPKIWANYNKGGKGTPLPSAAEPIPVLNEAEIRRRLGRV